MTLGSQDERMEPRGGRHEAVAGYAVPYQEIRLELVKQTLQPGDVKDVSGERVEPRSQCVEGHGLRGRGWVAERRHVHLVPEHARQVPHPRQRVDVATVGDEADLHTGITGACLARYGFLGRC